jgi:hypothetical protein
MSAACRERDRRRGRGGAGAGAAADGAADDARSQRYDLGSAVCVDSMNSMNGLPRLGHGLAESFVGSLLCGCGSCKGRCCMWAANGAEGRER